MSIRIDAEALAVRNSRIEAERALQRALEEDGIQVYYQPIYSVAKGKICALEALVRIVDETGRCFMPDSFIPLAEKNGMILKLGCIVFRKVCAFMKKEQPERLGIEYVEVNLSVIQCMQENLAEQYLHIMRENEISPHRINLEITETAAVYSEKTLLHNMEELIREGTVFSLDDYGSGYSSLGYVLKLPVRTIKLDKEMVWSYFSSERSAIAMRHEVAMLHELGLFIVAEGVEDEKQYTAMKELGIDYIQGYYFSRPLPQEELLTYLGNW